MELKEKQNNVGAKPGDKLALYNTNDDCMAETYDFYYESCTRIEGMPELGTNCSWVYSYSLTVINCVPGSEGPGGGPPDGGYPGTGGTGNPGGTGNTVGDITSEFDGYPCAKALVEKMKTLNSDIANLIKNAFGVNDIDNINFSPGPSLSGTNVDGRNNSKSAGTYQIIINPDVLKNSTKEYILVTLYHEALHAYFSQKLETLGAVEFNRQFTGIDVNNGRLLEVLNEAHTEMGYDRFVRGLKDAITAFNPSFDAARALALAQAGIVKLNATESKINDQERNSSTESTGTKCPK